MFGQKWDSINFVFPVCIELEIRNWKWNLSLFFNLQICLLVIKLLGKM